MQGRVTISAISEALGLSETEVAARARKEAWVATSGNCFIKLTLPPYVLSAVNAVQALNGPNLPAVIAAAPAVPEKQKSNALAKADLLKAYTDALAKAPRGQKETARTRFMSAYNAQVLLPQVFAQLGKVSWQTVETWKRTVKTKGDTFALAEKRGAWRRGQSCVSEEEGKCLLACALSPNAPLLAEVIRAARGLMTDRGVPDLASDATYKRWLLDYEATHNPVWTFTRRGKKAWNDECAFSIERDYDKIEVGDALVADGHRLNFEVINPWTGKACRMLLVAWFDLKSAMILGWEILPEENTASINTALRRSILALGKIPQYAYLDNGKAFKSRFFTQAVDFRQAGYAGLYKRLGMDTIFAWPYHAQSKPIERFFKTFGELERSAPTYVGTEISKKPPRLSRGEMIHRAAWDKVMGGLGPVTLADAHAAIAEWFDVYNGRLHQGGHLAGQRSVDVFSAGKGPGIDPVLLRELMFAEKSALVRRSVVKVFKRQYFAPELYQLKASVMIRYDLQDPETVDCYDEKTGEFICTARDLGKVHPLAKLGNEDDRARLVEQIRIKKAQERDASRVCRSVLASDVLPQVRRMAEEAGFGQSLPESPTKLIEAGFDADKFERELAEVEALNEAPEPEDFFAGIDSLSEADRYERILTAQFEGREIPERLVLFARYFETTATYRASAEYYEDFNVRLACGEAQAAAM